MSEDYGVGGSCVTTFAADYQKLYFALEAKNKEELTGPLNAHIEQQSREIAQWKSANEYQRQVIEDLRQQNYVQGLKGAKMVNLIEQQAELIEKLRLHKEHLLDAISIATPVMRSCATDSRMEAFENRIILGTVGDGKGE